MVEVLDVTNTALCIGVLQVEAMAQLGGILMIDPSNEASKNNFFFGGVDNCKWRKPVVPGDCLVSEAAPTSYSVMLPQRNVSNMQLMLLNNWCCKLLTAVMLHSGAYHCLKFA